MSIAKPLRKIYLYQDFPELVLVRNKRELYLKGRQTRNLFNNRELAKIFPIPQLKQEFLVTCSSCHNSLMPYFSNNLKITVFSVLENWKGKFYLRRKKGELCVRLFSYGVV
ncbi:hypothetical protein BV378_16035 [Nostoc sp. RF31YmG]|nr:hypothetical protein BV378_16035 [Nostoc sp. RF31YmG]